MWIWIVVVLFLLWLVAPPRESFASGKTPDDIKTALKSANSEMADALNLAKYRGQYEDIIIACEDWANLKMVTLLSENITSSTSSVTAFNELAKFKANLNDCMTYLDKA